VHGRRRIGRHCGLARHAAGLEDVGHGGARGALRVVLAVGDCGRGRVVELDVRRVVARRGRRRCHLMLHLAAVGAGGRGGAGGGAGGAGGCRRRHV